MFNIFQFKPLISGIYNFCPGFLASAAYRTQKIQKAISHSPNADRILLGITLFLSMALFVYGNTFPFGYHYDEDKKTRFVLSDRQDFHHPLLMIQLVRLANEFFGFSDKQNVAILGRWITATASIFLLLAMYHLSKRRMPRRLAILCALAVGICPTVVLHSHYLKEDMYFTAAAMFAVFAYVRFYECASTNNAMTFGVLFGLTIASHYKALLLALVFICFHFHKSIRLLKEANNSDLITINGSLKQSIRNHHLRIFLIRSFVAILVSLLVFVTINWPALYDPSKLLRGSSHELNHVIQGHNGVVIYALPQWFTYYWKNGILNGMTVPFGLLASAAFVRAVQRWSKIVVQDKLLISVAFINYVIPELSPSKPEPDEARYVIIVVVILIYFFTQAINELISIKNKIIQTMTFIVSFAVILLASLDSLFIDFHMLQDTRAEAQRWVQSNLPPGSRILWKPLTCERHVEPYEDFDLNAVEKSGIEYLIVSSFQYTRYVNARFLPDQSERIYKQSRDYLSAFKHPMVEFLPKYKTIGFSNPTIRIIRLTQTGKKNLKTEQAFVSE